MNNAIKKYLFLINILLLTGLTNLYANTSIDNASFLQQKNTLNYSFHFSTQLNLNQSPDYSTENNNGKKTYKEFIDFETFEENDEDKLDINFKSLSFGSSIAAIFYVQLLDNLNSELQASKQRYVFNYTTTSLRLHAKFQVFII